MTGERAMLPLAEALRGVRLLPLQAADAEQAAKVHRLLDLGHAARRREAETQALLAAAQALQQTVQTLTAAVQARLGQVADLAVEIGLCVAREVVGEALQRGLLDPAPVVLHCLRDAVHGADRADLAIHLHPDDLGPVLERLAQVPGAAAALADATLAPDPGLARGAVRAETGAGRLRYEPQEVFLRIAAAVRNAAAGGGPGAGGGA